MEILALAPVSVGHLTWRTAQNAGRLTVVVKATFALDQDRSARLVAPLPLFSDQHFEDDPTRSLRTASDLAPRKPRADVLFAGGVYAPVGQRVARRTARLALERAEGAPALDKRILALGPRTREAGVVSEPTAFGYLPVRYELSLGGPVSKINPAGVGADASDSRMPNFVDPAHEGRPTGLGPVPGRWFWRSRAAGRTDPAAWLTETPTLPPNVDLSYFNAAPPDQQIAALRGDEWLVLEGLHPTIERVRSRLPGLGAHARVRLPAGGGGEPREETLALTLDTLWIEGDTLTCALVWRGDVALPALDAAAGAHVAATLAPLGASPDFTATLALPPPPEPPPAATREPPPPASERAEPPPEIATPAALKPAEEPALWAAPKFDAESTRSPSLEKRPTRDSSKPAPSPPPRTTDAVPIVLASRLKPFLVPWQIRPPTDVLAVAVKGTFTLTEGAATLAEEQDPPCGDVYEDDDPEQCGLRYASDFAVFKPAADVTMVGKAYPDPKNKTVGLAQLRLGALRRSVAVVGERRWAKDGSASPPATFDAMPLRWERALGGPLSPDNPVGRGFRTGVVLPNLEQPDALITRQSDAPPPACFAPVAPAWRARHAKLGTYDTAWLKTRWPYFPADFDWRYFNAAPASQQIPYPTGNEELAIGGVLPDRPSLVSRLPAMRPRVFVQYTAEAGGDFFELKLRIDTVWVDAEAKKLVVVWRGLLEARADDAPEVACLFVLDEARSSKELTLEDARARLFAELALRGFAPAGAPPVPEEAPAPGLTALAAPIATPAQVAAWLAAGELAGKDLSGADLTTLALAGADLSGALLARASLRGVNLDGANLAGAVLEGADAAGASFVGANLTGADLSGADLTEARMKGARLEDATLSRVRAERADLTEVQAARAVLREALLEGARFERADLREAELSRAKLGRARFGGAKLDQARLYEAVGERVSFDGASLTGLRADAAKLKLASLAGAAGPESTWERTDLSGAVLREAKLARAMFCRTNLEGASLNQADLGEATFRRAILRRATLLKANLMKANLEGADLAGADLRGANLFQAETWRAKTQGADLSMALTGGSKLA